MTKRRAAQPQARAAIMIAAISIAAVAALPVVGAVGNPSEHEDIAARRVQSAALLEEGRSALTFQMLEPTWLPDGYSLEHIAWFAPGYGLDISESSMDTWYSAPGTPRIHVWQTDNPEIPAEADPVSFGEQIMLAGRPWSLAEDFRGEDLHAVTMLSTRLPDGTTLSVDGALPSDVLARFAEGLKPIVSE
jgi:hypothetical protein